MEINPSIFSSPSTSGAQRLYPLLEDTADSFSKELDRIIDRPPIRTYSKLNPQDYNFCPFTTSVIRIPDPIFDYTSLINSSPSQTGFKRFTATVVTTTSPKSIPSISSFSPISFKQTNVKLNPNQSVRPKTLSLRTQVFSRSTGTQPIVQRPPSPEMSVVDPQIFSGVKGDDAYHWIQRFIALANGNNWSTDEQKIRHMYAYLDSVALSWFLSENFDPTATTFDEVKKRFLSYFDSSSNNTLTLEFELQNRNRKKGESPVSYYQNVLELCRRIDPNMTEEKKVKELMKGLYPLEKSFTYMLKPTNIEDFWNKFQTVTESLTLSQSQTEENERNVNLVDSGPNMNPKTMERSLELETLFQVLMNQMNELKDELRTAKERTPISNPQRNFNNQNFNRNFNNNQNQNLNRNPNNNSNYNPNYNPNFNSRNYNQGFNNRSNNPNFNQGNFNNRNQNYNPNYNNQIRNQGSSNQTNRANWIPARTSEGLPNCFKCHKAGHVAKFCPNPPVQNQNPTNNKESPQGN